MNDFDSNVFINCPLDKEYFQLLQPLLFTILFLNFIPRLALERADSGEPRIIKICELIKNSKYSIHDLSRIRSNRKGEYYRLNMPFELGLDIGARYYGDSIYKEKKFLILGKDLYKYKIAISDLSNSDIKQHQNRPNKMVLAVRDWFAENDYHEAPSGRQIWYAFNNYTDYLFDDRKKKGFLKKEIYNMPIKEYIDCIKKWKSDLG